MPFSQMNPHVRCHLHTVSFWLQKLLVLLIFSNIVLLQAHHPGMGPGAMHTDDQDFMASEFFSSAPQPQMGSAHGGMPNALTASPSWGGPATQPEPNWFGPADNSLPQGGRGAMPHTVSAPSPVSYTHLTLPTKA